VPAVARNGGFPIFSGRADKIITLDDVKASEDEI